ncbi:hypothetical protein CHLRE_17g737353v5 [Chlamydomonas reinhardtii]|uniref:Uncharacterized protein n=1 Tax=Chlamydomonas reinhardtii TaxID=3055 RepID=A0A2K3CRH4_CHLRE|nr:uncharacterized protein CHLRE_17g737353v5 [Chlamydomonas reinhardtii]PNW70883.1 hypothetical protein CHLRE_17g737353v5 [Chlamydomonas reinhardtii]
MTTSTDCRPVPHPHEDCLGCHGQPPAASRAASVTRTFTLVPNVLERLWSEVDQHVRGGPARVAGRQ